MGAVGGGGWFVGTDRISMSEGGSGPPQSWSAAGRNNSGGSIESVTFGAGWSGTPPAIGDAMVVGLGAGTYIAGSPWVVTPPPGWTELYATTSADTVITNLYYKLADADDAAETASYTFSFSASGGLVGLAAVIATWPARYGTLVTDAGPLPRSASSAPSPGGDWQIAFAYERTASNFAQPSPNPVISSADAVLFAESGGSYRSGILRLYSSDNADPITASYIHPTIDFVRRGMVVAAVSSERVVA